MAIFQFNIRDKCGLVLDDEGIELPDIVAAAREAVRSASEFLTEASSPTDMAFEITDETGRLVLIVPIADRRNLLSEDDLTLAS